MNKIKELALKREHHSQKNIFNFKWFSTPRQKQKTVPKKVYVQLTQQ